MSLAAKAMLSTASELPYPFLEFLRKQSTSCDPATFDNPEDYSPGTVANDKAIDDYRPGYDSFDKYKLAFLAHFIKTLEPPLACLRSSITFAFPVTLKPALLGKAEKGHLSERDIKDAVNLPGKGYVDDVTKFPNCDESKRFQVDYLGLEAYFMESKAKMEAVERQMHREKILQDIKQGMVLGGHANMILVDNVERTISFIEPHGEASWRDHVEDALKRHFADIKGYRFIPGAESCPKIGVQSVANQGICRNLSFLIVILKLMHPDVSTAEISSKMAQLGRDTILMLHKGFVCFMWKFVADSGIIGAYEKVNKLFPPVVGFDFDTGRTWTRPRNIPDIFQRVLVAGPYSALDDMIKLWSKWEAYIATLPEEVEEGGDEVYDRQTDEFHAMMELTAKPNRTASETIALQAYIDTPLEYETSDD